MTKNEIVEEICEDTGFRKAVVEITVDSFEPKERAAKCGRNPKTNEPVRIPKRILPAFRAGKVLKQAVLKNN